MLPRWAPDAWLGGPTCRQSHTAGQQEDAGQGENRVSHARQTAGPLSGESQRHRFHSICGRADREGPPQGRVWPQGRQRRRRRFCGALQSQKGRPDPHEDIYLLRARYQGAQIQHDHAGGMLRRGGPSGEGRLQISIAHSVQAPLKQLCPQIGARPLMRTDDPDSRRSPHAHAHMGYDRMRECTLLAR